MDEKAPCTFDDVEFCTLKGTLEETYARMTSDQMLELADHLHDAIRSRGADPRSGRDSCDAAMAPAA